MSYSEDYLDGLLSSINKAKTDVENSQNKDKEALEAKVLDRQSVDPNDDFMDATGLTGFKPRKVSHENLRKAFSESDFLKDFEDELSSGDADDFIRAFEEEIDEEEAAFERGEVVEDDAGAEFIRSLMDEDEVEAYDSNSEATANNSVAEEATANADKESNDDESEYDASEDTSSENNVLYDAEALMNELGNAELSEADLDEANVEDTDSEEAQEASNDDTQEEAEDSYDSGADELLKSLENAEESSEEESEDSSDENLDDLLNNVQSIVDGDVEKNDSLLSEEFQNDEHDALDVLNINEDGIALVDENEDLDALLANEEGMSDINDLLKADSENVELEEARDNFEESAGKLEKEASSDDSSEEVAEKKGFFAKLKALFSKKKKVEETETVDMSSSSSEDTTEENAKILEEMEDEDTAEEAAKKDKAEKKKEKAAAKSAAKKEKADAKAAAKKEKADAKNNKEPSALSKFFKDDKSKKVPIKVIVIFVLFAVTVVVAVLFGGKIIHDKEVMKKANSEYAKANYVECYEALKGMNSTDSEKEYYNNVQLLASLQNKYREYNLFMNKKDYENALDALIVGVGRFAKNKEYADSHGITAEFNSLGSMLEQQLQNQFGMTKDEAVKLYQESDRVKYTNSVKAKLKALGMESTNNDSNT